MATRTLDTVMIVVYGRVPGAVVVTLEFRPELNLFERIAAATGRSCRGGTAMRVRSHESLVHAVEELIG